MSYAIKENILNSYIINIKLGGMVTGMWGFFGKNKTNIKQISERRNKYYIIQRLFIEKIWYT